jgi:NAD(P) transhydrogenase subunit beta
VTYENVYPFVWLAWLAGAACFILGLHYMNSPATARNGNRLSAAGMAVAVGATAILLLVQGISAGAWAIIIVGFLIGGAVGLWTARTVPMTAMPQLVSVFNAVGGGAAALVAIADFLAHGEQGGANVSTTIFVVLGVASSRSSGRSASSSTRPASCASTPRSRTSSCSRSSARRSCSA